jgi:hypothetical protein
MALIEKIGWRPEIGDPSTLGWITVAAYCLVAFLAFLAAWRTDSDPPKARASTWVLVGLLMSFLCINKQLDLQSLVTDIGRVISVEYGWYERRREFQKELVITVIAISTVTTGYLAIRYREFWLRNLALTSGLTVLITFIMVRAISFHHFDQLIKIELSGARVNWIMELTGIALIGIAAVTALTRNKASAAPIKRK